VDIDLSKFFDRIHHDRLIARMGEKVTDKRILRLVGLMLRSGIMINGVVIPSQEGAMQGGPLSPLLSNIVLDELDQELERRGLEFCRFAGVIRCKLLLMTRWTNLTKPFKRALKNLLPQRLRRLDAI